MLDCQADQAAAAAVEQVHSLRVVQALQDKETTVRRRRAEVLLVAEAGPGVLVP
jgi:hypothetical protein